MKRPSWNDNLEIKLPLQLLKCSQHPKGKTDPRSDLAWKSTDTQICLSRKSQGQRSLLQSMKSPREAWLTTHACTTDMSTVLRGFSYIFPRARAISYHETFARKTVSDKSVSQYLNFRNRTSKKLMPIMDGHSGHWILVKDDSSYSCLLCSPSEKCQVSQHPGRRW